MDILSEVGDELSSKTRYLRNLVEVLEILGRYRVGWVGLWWGEIY